MDQIEITIKQEQVDDGAIFVRVQVNGDNLPGILNVEAFFMVPR